MTDLKIPNLNKNSDKYLFKKKLTLRRKSRSKLLKESFFMLLLSNFILLLNYSIPNKKIVFDNFFRNFSGLLGEVTSALSFSYNILLAFFIITSMTLALVLIIGALLRILKILKRKTKQISFK